VKSTKDRRTLAVQYYEDGMPTYEIALKFYITRATLYRWFKEEGVVLNRQKRGGGEHHRSSKCGVLAEKMGVSMPTARKYLRVLSDAEIEGIITLEDLRKLGFSGAKQKIVLAFLEQAGYAYDEKDMSLDKESGGVDDLKFLTISEVVELFTDPGRFLNER
jgi:transposase